MRHICVFLGAGSSRPAGLPDMNGLSSAVSTTLREPDRATFEAMVGDHGLEGTLTRLRRIAALVEGDDEIQGVSGTQADRLDAAICSAIVSALSAIPANTRAADDFAAWIARANYSRPVEVFTVNYDLMIETALDKIGAPYFDGFIGMQRARFRSDLIEARETDENYIPAFFARVWKMHGSLNWEASATGVVRLGSTVRAGRSAAIYPSDAKYHESRRMPFVVLQDRFRRALYENETLALVAGYSWGDEHLNEYLFDAASRRQRSEVIAFSHGELPVELVDFARRTPNLQLIGSTEAVIGGVRGRWQEPEDTQLPSDVWADQKLKLGDFASLASFLARASGASSPDQTEVAAAPNREAGAADGGA